MPQSPLQDVVAHWHKLVENFQTSPIAFYAAVEDALRRRKVPDLRTTQVIWNEGGILSPRREYLRVFGEHHIFDLCAAPFGTGCFFSSWVTNQKARWVVLYYALFLFGAFIFWRLLHFLTQAAWRSSDGLIGSVLRMALFNDIVLIAVAVLLVLWGVGLAARAESHESGRAMLTVPFLGWLYQKMFAPQTYYRLDTMYMFQSAVQSAMLEVINGLLTAKGLRALNEAEGKPVQQQLVDGKHAIPDEVVTAMAGAR